MSSQGVRQEPIFWTVVTGFGLSIGVVVLMNATRNEGEPLTGRFVFEYVVPIYLPILMAMLAFFFQAGEATVRPASGPQDRIAHFVLGAYSILPPVLIFGMQKAELPELLTNYQKVGITVIATVLAYYYGTKVGGK